MYKLLEYNFLWNCLEFSNKVDLTIEIGAFSNVKHCHAIYFKFKDRFFKLLLPCEELKQKPVSVLHLKKSNFIAVSLYYCYIVSIFVVVIN